MEPHALIIDDNANNVEILTRLLKNQHVTYTAIGDSSQVSEALGQLEHINVIFCDLEMPYLTGYDLLPILRQAVGTTVPIVVYSVHASEINQARELGFDGFLVKPIDPDGFPKHLVRILEGKPVWVLS